VVLCLCVCVCCQHFVVKQVRAGGTLDVAIVTQSCVEVLALMCAACVGASPGVSKHVLTSGLGCLMWRPPAMSDTETGGKRERKPERKPKHKAEHKAERKPDDVAWEFVCKTVFACQKLVDSHDVPTSARSAIFRSLGAAVVALACASPACVCPSDEVSACTLASLAHRLCGLPEVTREDIVLAAQIAWVCARASMRPYRGTKHVTPMAKKVADQLVSVCDSIVGSVVACDSSVAAALAWGALTNVMVSTAVPAAHYQRVLDVVCRAAKHVMDVVGERAADHIAQPLCAFVMAVLMSEWNETDSLDHAIVKSCDTVLDVCTLVAGQCSKSRSMNDAIMVRQAARVPPLSSVLFWKLCG
jgi:hypothetical protein